MQEQEEQELWEWCGLEWRWNHNPECNCGAIDDDDSNRSWYTKEGELATRFYHEQMVVDLNNLFRYAVPKLYLELCRKGQYHKIKPIYEALEQEIIKGSTESEINPAQALYQAIQKVRKSCSH